jgi:hypothetical protein
MSALTRLIPLLIAASTRDCYLVTRDRIEIIPCNFDAAVTDALRYAAEDAAPARRKAGPQRRDVGAAPRFAPRPLMPSGRGSARTDSRR